ncbi:MAG TPA: hypothetical protein VF574_15570 [Allosphingosinicella sp.]
MIARGFKSVIWVATVGGAALSCYMVSLRVATERNELAKVERQIVAAKRDIRSLQTELGTRGRMTQLEQWNAEVLALSAPSSAQFLKDEFTLARLYRNDPTVADRSAEVRLASADAAAKPADTAKPATPPVVQAVADRPEPQPPMIHRASFTPSEAPARARPAVAQSERVRTAVPVAEPDKPAAQRTPSLVQRKSEPGRAVVKPTTKVAKPQDQRTASAATPKPEATSGRPTAKPAAARPVREAAAAPRAAKAKGGGGN